MIRRSPVPRRTPTPTEACDVGGPPYGGGHEKEDAVSMSLTPQEIAWLDQEHRRIADMIRRFGHAIEYVGGDDAARSPSFAYSIGLSGLGHPELLVFGLGSGDAGAVINDIAAHIRGGSPLVPGELIAVEGFGRRLCVEELPNPGEVLYAANGFYERPPFAPLPAYQLTYADASGRFPGQEGYADAPWRQPRPGTFRA